MHKFVPSILVAALLGASLAVPHFSRAEELPSCESLGYPTDPAVSCTGPTAPTGTTEPTGPANPTCAEVPDPTTIPCTGPTDAEPKYNWVWNGTAWEAEGYPWVWDGTQWVPAPPPTISATIENTGPNSTNTSSASSTTDTTLNQENTAAISNNIQANLNTGDNSVLHNTTAGDLTSGDIKMTVELLNFINSVTSLGGGTLTMVDIPTDYHGNIDLTRLSPELINTILAYYVGSIFDILARNTNTGPGSTNTANASSQNNLLVNSNHNAAINNNIALTGNTGGNTASGNTQVGNLKTGNIDVAVNLINIINSILSVPVLDLAILNIFGSLFGDLYLDPALFGTGGGTSATNSTTGPNSTNTATATSSNTLDATATNNANIANNLAINANTGGNTMGNNTTAGNLTTGSVDIGIAINDIIRQITGDSWFLVFVNVLGQWTGQILGINGSNGSVVVFSGPQLTAGNSNTGPNSTNTATATSENNTTINANSDATIGNTLNLDLNTGNNTVEGNTLAGNLTSGNIKVVGNILNIINQAISLNKRLYLGFINIMGNWFGNLMPRPPAPTVAGTGGNTNGTNSAGTEVVFQPSIVSSAPEQSGDSQGTVSSETRPASPRSATNRSGEGQGSGETITLAGFQSGPELPGASQAAAARALGVWKIISLGLFLFGTLLLVADLVSRRRKASQTE